MAGIPVGGVVIPQEFDVTVADAVMALGTTFTDDVGSIFTYVTGVASVVDGDACQIASGHALVRLLTANIGTRYPLGVARAAIVATEFGFAQVVGHESGGGVNVLASAAAEVALQTTATPGELDDAATTAITRITLATAQGGSPGINTSAIFRYPGID